MSGWGEGAATRSVNLLDLLTLRMGSGCDVVSTGPTPLWPAPEERAASPAADADAVSDRCPARDRSDH